MVQLKRGLLRTTALCLGLAAPLIVTSQSAEASCTSYSPTSGTTVTCSGMSTSGVSAKSGAANVIVNLGAGAQLTAASGIGVQSSSTINISGSVVATNGIAAIVAGDNSAINLSGTAVLIGRDVAVLLFGNDNMVSVADLSQIEAGLYAIQVAGNENTINFSGSATAQSDGNVLLVEGDGNKIFLNDTVLISGRGGPLIVGTGNLVTAIGGDGEVAEGLRLGGFIGTTMGEEEVASKGGGSTSQGLLGMVYGTVRKAGAFLSAAMGGGYQTYELSRKASVAGTLMTAEADTEGVQFGGRVEAGAEIGLPKDWVLTPRASVLYVHHRIEGYDESGAEVGNVAMDDHNTGSLRLKAEMDAGQKYETDSVVYRPHVKIGVLADIMPGNEVEGYFLDSGTPFELPLSKGERFRALGRIGLEAHFAGGSVAQLSYEGEAGSDSVAHALMATLKLDW